MSDIVERLRMDAIGWEHAQHTLTGPFIAALEREAADEIERLRRRAHQLEWELAAINFAHKELAHRLADVGWEIKQSALNRDPI